VKLLKRLVDLDEILDGDDDIEDDLDFKLFNSVAQPFQNGGRLNF
jgi:hypothetical protein